MILEIGNWVKVKGDDEYYEILSIDIDAAQLMLSDITGHKYAAFKREIEKVVTNEELYGFEPTTADEFNEEIITYGDKKLKDYGPPYGPHNPTGNEGEIK